MGIIHDGLNAYILVNGQRALVMAEREIMGIEDQVIYDYTRKSGVLKLNPSNLPEGDLEKLAQDARACPKTGINITLELDALGDKIFQGVKRVEPLPQEETVLRYSSPELN